jgi:hypothetical protein
MTTLAGNRMVEPPQPQTPHALLSVNSVPASSNSALNVKIGGGDL